MTRKRRRRVQRAIFGGALALQAAPMLRAGGRTPAALTGTATGFVGIGVAGAAAGAAFEMVKTPRVLTKKRKKKRR